MVRALVLNEHWKALGGRATLAISGDERARRVGSGRHPFLDEPLPVDVVDLGEDLHAPVPSQVQASATVALLDQWEATVDQIQGLRPLKVAVMEDDGDAHEQADLLFQPYLEGVSWPSSPVKDVNGRKVRPYETSHEQCRVLRGSTYIVISPVALQRRPKREPLQPLAVHKLLVTFGGTDGPGLAQRAHDMLADLVAQGRWSGACTLLAPGGFQGTPFPGCRVLDAIPNLTHRLQDFDAVWCAGGLTIAESVCQGVPVAAWAQNERQHRMIADMALVNGCYDLGLGPEADPHTTEYALEQWLGPEGQESRQEQTRDGMALIDGMGASRVAQAIWALAAG